MAEKHGPRPRTPREVYVLRDPRTNEGRYVGESQSAAQRYGQHVGWARSRMGMPNERPLDRWIVELLDAGLRPVLEIVETGVPYDIRQGVEAQWINAFEDEGHPLLNPALFTMGPAAFARAARARRRAARSGGAS